MMLRILRRATGLFAAYVVVLLAVVVAGFLYGAVGAWATFAWGIAVSAGTVVYVGRKWRRPRFDE